MKWICINPLPKHEEKVEIMLKNGKVLEAFYDSIEREFYEIRDGAHYFYDLEKVSMWLSSVP